MVEEAIVRSVQIVIAVLTITLCLTLFMMGHDFGNKMIRAVDNAQTMPKFKELDGVVYNADSMYSYILTNLDVDDYRYDVDTPIDFGNISIIKNLGGRWEISLIEDLDTNTYYLEVTEK